MKKLIILICGISLAGCAGSKMPPYRYENNHVLDDELNNKMCMVIDNKSTIYMKGHKSLPSNPFTGNEPLDTNSVEKSEKPCEYDYKNDKCKNPINIRREIEVSSVSFPVTCVDKNYAGSVYTGGVTNHYGNTSYTSISSMPVYNNSYYQCTRVDSVVTIQFYKDKTLLGFIGNRRWETQDINKTIDSFTKEFMKISSKEAK